MPELPRDPRQLARDILSGKVRIEDLARQRQLRAPSAAAPPRTPRSTPSRENPPCPHRSPPVPAHLPSSTSPPTPGPPNVPRTCRSLPEAPAPKPLPFARPTPATQTPAHYHSATASIRHASRAGPTIHLRARVPPSRANPATGAQQTRVAPGNDPRGDSRPPGLFARLNHAPPHRFWCHAVGPAMQAQTCTRTKLVAHSWWAKSMLTRQIPRFPGSPRNYVHAHHVSSSNSL